MTDISVLQQGLDENNFDEPEDFEVGKWIRLAENYPPEGDEVNVLYRLPQGTLGRTVGIWWECNGDEKPGWELDFETPAKQTVLAWAALLPVPGWAE